MLTPPGGKGQNQGKGRIPLAAARLHVLKKARRESKVTAKKRNTLLSGRRTRELSDHVQGPRAPRKLNSAPKTGQLLVYVG